MALEKKPWDGDGVLLKDSNCALIGSAEDHEARKRAAQTEPAWTGCGLKPGVEVWRVENQPHKFGVQAWDKKKYGKFHKGDSYIVLSTWKEPETEKLHHDIHFWLGKESTTDEIGTAAYKTAELDDYFDGEPVQHREVMGNESEAFRKLFRSITYLEGGFASGFTKAGRDVYEHHLYIVRRTRPVGMQVLEMPLSRSSLNQGDSFVLDAGDKIYVWLGGHSSPFEKHKAGVYAENLENQREGRCRATHECDDRFWELLGGPGDIKRDADDALVQKASEVARSEAVLFQVTDKAGTLECKEVGKGSLRLDMLVSDDVMMLVAFGELCLWVGKGASVAEGHSCYRLAMEFLRRNGRRVDTPIHMFKEGSRITDKHWNDAFSLAGGGAGGGA